MSTTTATGDYVDYDTAKKLKRVGYNIKSEYVYVGKTLRKFCSQVDWNHVKRNELKSEKDKHIYEFVDKYKRESLYTCCHIYDVIKWLDTKGLHITSVYITKDEWDYFLISDKLSISLESEVEYDDRTTCIRGAINKALQMI